MAQKTYAQANSRDKENLSVHRLQALQLLWDEWEFSYRTEFWKYLKYFTYCVLNRRHQKRSLKYDKYLHV